jgi:hypothetical protein
MPCCNTCEDIKLAYQKRKWAFDQFNFEQCKSERINLKTVADEAFEKLLQLKQGCRITGSIEVKKVTGSFHLAPGFTASNSDHGHSHGHTHELKRSHIDRLSTSHRIETLYFGDKIYPNQVNALDKTIQVGTEKASVSYTYFVKVVPTVYQYKNGTLLTSVFQYSVTKSSKTVSVEGSAIPIIIFNYELSPIMVKFIEKQKSLIHFVTSCCAIIGGIFTIAGLLDAFLFRYRNLYLKERKLT